MSDDVSSSSPRQNERTRLSADERRLMLVQAAYHLIAEKGLLGLRIREVADRVGVNHTTLVYHFPTKESLIAAVIDYVGTLFLTTQAPECTNEATPSPRDRLHCYFINVAYQIRTTPEHFLVIDELFLQAQRDPVMRHLLHAEEAWVAYLTAILEDGIQQGIFAPNVPITTIVYTIMTFCKGLPLQMTSQTDDAAQVIQQFEQWVLLTLLPH
jgi:AcrR family transcriptional regulator